MIALKRIILLGITSCCLADAGAQYLSTERGIYPTEPADPEIVIRPLLDLADKISMSDPDSAMSLYSQGEKDSRMMEYNRGIILSLGGLANCYRIKGDYEKSIYLFRETIAKARHIRDKSRCFLLTYLYLGLAVTYEHQGSYTTSVLHYFTALDLAKQEWYNREVLYLMAQAYNTLSTLWINLGEMEQGWKDLQTAVQITRMIGDSTLIPSLLFTRAHAYVNSRNTKASLAYLQRALGEAERQDIPHLQLASLIVMGRVYIMEGQPEHAVACFSKADSIRKRKIRNNIAMTIDVNYHMGFVYFYRQQHRQTKELMRKTLDTAAAIGYNSVTIANLHCALAFTYADDRNFYQAYRHQDTAFKLNERMVHEEKNKIAGLLLQYRTAEKDREIARTQLQLTRKESQLKETKIWLGAISGGILLLAAFLASIYRSNKHRRQVIHLKAMIQGEERERSRIALELHDGIGGILAGIKMHFNAIQKEHPRIFQLIRMNDIKKIVYEAADELRKTAHNFTPGILMHHNFPDALQIYCGQINKTGQLHIDLQCYGALEEIEETLALTLYRIIQELIQNMLKHAQASHAVIQVLKQEKYLSITVEDNGIGFDLTGKTEGTGLRNLELRVKTLRGKLTIESAKNAGTITCITFEYPIKM